MLCCCIVLILKIVTDIQADQVQKLNEKLSSEWSLLKKFTQYVDLSIVTYTSFTFITGLLVITRVLMPIYNRETFEKLILVLGMVLYLFEGISALLTTEYAYEIIQTNYFVLGGLSILIALLFMFDLCYFNRKEMIDNNTQTENNSLVKNYMSVQSTQNYSTEARIHCCSNTENFKVKRLNSIVPSINNVRKTQYLSTEL